jgi:hypothetical protein
MPVSVWAATTSVIPPWAASASPALMVRSGPPYFYVFTHIPLALPAVRDLTPDGRVRTYDESALKLSKVSFRGTPSKATITNQTRLAGSFSSS